MIHIYKAGGDYTRNNISYSIKCIAEDKLSKHLKDGWAQSFNEIKPAKKKKAKEQATTNDTSNN
tara:strand:+ start:6133 stop:6324 length:192 start_codon:yes stop_codon:yes gene_type:complete